MVPVPARAAIVGTMAVAATKPLQVMGRARVAEQPPRERDPLGVHGASRPRHSMFKAFNATQATAAALNAESILFGGTLRVSEVSHTEGGT